MLLDAAKLENLCTGALSVMTNEDGSFTPIRFTDKQLAFYSRTESDRIRSYAAAGISLHCITDASAVRLKYTVLPGSSQDVYGFDVYAGGEMIFHCQAKISEKPDGEIRCDLPAGIKRLRVFFPNLAILRIHELELTDANVCTPVNGKRVLLLGDSIMQGYTTWFSSYTLANLLSESLNAAILNQGVAGEVFEEDMLDYAGFAPDLIVTAYGTNDWNLLQKDVFHREAAKYLDRLSRVYPSSPVAVLTPIWRADADTPHSEGFVFRDTCDILKEIVSKYPNMTLIDGASLMPPVTEFYADRLVHPNELGFLEYAKRLCGKLTAIKW